MNRLVATVVIVLSLFVATSAIAGPATKDSTGRIEIVGWRIYNNCGDNVDMQKGSLQSKYRVDWNANGGVSVQSHFELHGAGHGVLTGEMFNVNDVDNFSFSGGDEGFEYNDVGKFTINQRGSQGQDQVLRYHRRLTVNANGIVTATFDRFVFECK